MTKTRKNRQRKKKLRYDRIIFVCLIFLAVSGLILFFFVKASPSKSEKSTQSQASRVQASQEKKGTESPKSVSFFAVGDNLVHNWLYISAQRLAGGTGYDFTPFFKDTQAEIKKADIAFIDQETPFAGEKFGGLSNYPMFNGPQEIARDLKKVGFDWINMATNHAMDRGAEAVLSEIDYVKSLGGILETGANASQQAQDEVKIIEKNGLKIAVDSFTYGLNGMPLPANQPWLINLTDKNLIKKHVEAMKKVSDVQVINMHWGTEYAKEEDAEQKELAQYLADLGVDVIIGEHPHQIQPVKWVTSKTGQKVLTIYSLGNFVSAQNTNDSMLGLAVDFSIKYDKGKVSVDNIKILPTITQITAPYSEQSDYNVKFLRDYSDTDATNHGVTGLGYDMSKTYFENQVNQIVGNPENMTIVK